LNNALGEQFSRGAQILLGRDSFAPQNWENQLFSRFVEAFEITAAQRGAPRWEIAGTMISNPAALSVTAKLTTRQLSIAAVKKAKHQATPTASDPRVVCFSEVGKGAFVTHLPLVGSLAAGAPFHGFETASLNDICDLNWIAVPSRLARARRFVVRVAGDSMEPLLKLGDLVVFEYHRSPRKDGQVVIANIPEFGSSDYGIETIKRIRQDSKNWIFQKRRQPLSSSLQFSKAIF
jgi:phage repressor protein C with HTH and peptisase S24 domain